jgi:DNA-binding transcriptional LysR family regulator
MAPNLAGRRRARGRPASAGRSVDWDKIRIFYTVAEAGSFTRAGDDLGLSQSAVSRQISALERELKAPLFHRHARGLILTEQGDLLFRAARDMRMRLETTRARLVETSERPSGELKVTTSIGLGASWIARRIGEFLDLYPDVRVELILINQDLDLAMREADVAIRLHRPHQPDLVQRRLFTVHHNAYASKDYIKHFGEPKTLADLDEHRIVTLAENQPAHFLEVHRFLTRSPDRKDLRQARLQVGDGLALRAAVATGAGIGMLPAYAAEGHSDLVQVLRDYETPSLDCYFVYAEEMRSIARLQAFRDFLIQKAQRWTY